MVDQQKNFSFRVNVFGRTQKEIQITGCKKVCFSKFFSLYLDEKSEWLDVFFCRKD